MNQLTENPILYIDYIIIFLTPKKKKKTQTNKPNEQTMIKEKMKQLITISFIMKTKTIKSLYKCRIKWWRRKDVVKRVKNEIGNIFLWSIGKQIITWPDKVFFFFFFWEKNSLRDLIYHARILSQESYNSIEIFCYFY